MKSDLPILTDAECSEVYGEDFDESSMICAGDITNGGVDSCNGDLGNYFSIVILLFMNNIAVDCTLHLNALSIFVQVDLY